jgi:Aspartyl protease
MGLRTIWAIVMAGLLLLADPLGSAQAGDNAKGNLSPNELPMNLVGGYIILVQVSIGDLHDLNFLLDTGATTSAIDRKLSERLNLPTQASKMVNFDKTVQVRWCVLPELVYGPRHATDIKVAIEDLSYLQTNGAPVDGVIGWDLLRQHSFRLDFANKRVIFSSIFTIDRNYVPLRENSLFLTVPIDLDGRPLWMIADTGMPGAMFYEPQLEDVSYQRQASISGRGVGGSVESQIVLVPRLRIATRDLDRHVYVVRSPNSALLDGVAGYLGIVSLNARQVTFDLDRRILSWQ